MSYYPWQYENWQHLLQSEKQGRLSQALLLEGPRGMGKEDFARAFSAYLLCEHPQETACQHCRSCTWFKAGTHPDYFYLAPEGVARQIKIDQIRAMLDKISETAHREGGRQVVLLSPVESMNRAAANALLKTLEEPPGPVYFLLVCHQGLTLPATIRSRCQPLFFWVQEESLALSWLTERTQNAETSLVAWRLSAGAPLQALNCVEKGWIVWRTQIMEHLLSMYEGRQNPLQSAALWLKQDIAQCLQLMMTVVLDVISLQLGARETQLIHQDEIGLLSALQGKVPQAHWLFFQKKVMQAQRDYYHHPNLNVELLLESLCLKWAAVHLR